MVSFCYHRNPLEYFQIVISGLISFRVFYKTLKTSLSIKFFSTNLVFKILKLKTFKNFFCIRTQLKVELQEVVKRNELLKYFIPSGDWTLM